MEALSPPIAVSQRQRARLVAILVSVFVSLLLMVAKFYIYWLTNSAAILSDALESIVNVVASSFALVSVVLAAKSPDPSHPYGHGKIEYFSAGFEGALIVLAALGIFYEAVPRVFAPRVLPHLEVGLLLLLAVSLLNLALGVAVVQVGRRTRSLALVADGKHILTDVYTSAGVLGGLALALWTGWYWLDGLAAVLVALNILYTGAQLMKESSAGIMDASDPKLLEEIAGILQEHRKDLWIDIHRLRARRSGDWVFIDFHLLVPKDLPLEEGHRQVKELEGIFNARYQGMADVLIHLDPCEQVECPICGFRPCSHRKAETKEQKLWRGETVTAEAPGKDEALTPVPGDTGKNKND